MKALTEAQLYERKIRVQNVIDRMLEHGDPYNKALEKLNSKYQVNSQIITEQEFHGSTRI